MIVPSQFLHILRAQGISFFTGVPDSLLKELCSCISAELPPQQHIIASNEGSAVGLAIGHYLATANPAMVYMQNSGLGNVVNPITSLADPEVYAIPMLLLVGWRGELLDEGGQLADEPQHRKQGKVTLAQLRTLDIPYRVLDADSPNPSEMLDDLLEQAALRCGPVALVVRKGTFAAYKGDSAGFAEPLPAREEAIEVILEASGQDVAVVSTTGKASREVFELRRAQSAGHHRDFLTVGGMGHASQIAAGIALARPEQQVICIDGDGAALMHLGSMANSADCDNLLHILINNAAHDSVGGQPTKGAVLDFSRLAHDMGYQHCARVDSLEDLRKLLSRFSAQTGSRFIEVHCQLGSRSELGRPDRSPQQNKQDFMQFLGAQDVR